MPKLKPAIEEGAVSDSVDEDSILASTVEDWQGDSSTRSPSIVWT